MKNTNRRRNKTLLLTIMAAIKVATFNGCKVYNLSSGKSQPAFLSESKKRQLAKDADYSRRVELIQDFEMPTSSQQITFCNDGEHIIMSGTYPPIIKCYTISDLSMKFQRGLNSEVVAFECLSDDFGKLCFLQVDRNLSFHAPYGAHYNVRVPKHGRCMKYYSDTCDMLVGGEGNEIYRLNLEAGQFRAPLPLSFDGCNKIECNNAFPLLAAGGGNGIVEFFDMRSRSSVCAIRPVENDSSGGGGGGSSSNGGEITALKFTSDGVTLGVGTSAGHCVLYDIRSSHALYRKEHQYGLPVLDVSFHESSGNILSTDRKVVKIWDSGKKGGTLGKILTNVETPSDINGITCVKDRRGDSGLIMLAGEQERVMTYFVPDLGPAPRWCSHLEGLTEELEESKEKTVYEDFKFVTKQEVDEIGATSLIGSPMMRAYMHGYFMEMSVYSKLRAASKPFEYDEFRKAKIQQKIDEKRASRITVRKRVPKVNAALAEKLEKQNKSGANAGTDELVDDRFKTLFTREEFEQDRDSYEFKLRNPVLGQEYLRKRGGGGGESEDELDQYNVDDGDAGGGGSSTMFDPVAIEDDDDDYDDYDDTPTGTGDGYGDSDSDLDNVRYEAGDDDELQAGNKKKKDARKKASKRGGKRDEDEEGAFARQTRVMQERKKEKEKGKSKGKEKSKLGMFELADGRSSSRASFQHADEERSKWRKEQAIENLPLSERVSSSAGRMEKEKVKTIHSKEGVVRELTFQPTRGDGTGKKGKVSSSKRGIVEDSKEGKKQSREMMERTLMMGGSMERGKGESAGNAKKAKR